MSLCLFCLFAEGFFTKTMMHTFVEIEQLFEGSTYTNAFYKIKILGLAQGTQVIENPSFNSNNVFKLNVKQT